MSEKKYTYGQDNQERAYRVLKVLLDYSDRGIEERKIKCSKTGNRLTFEIYKTDLIALLTAQYPKSDWDNDIRPVISHYLEWLGILVDNRTTKRGSSLWDFSLNLWCEDSQKNLQRFRDEWEQKSPERTQKNNTEPSKNLRSNTSNGIDWFAISLDLLTHQKNLTTNPLQLGATRNLDDVHVPLGLMERKERPKVKQEPSPEEGSQLYRETELTETKRFEHDEFLAEVVGKRTAGSKHIAIIGEPGAGKTTLLTKIGECLLNLESESEPLLVAWVSLASLENQDLSDYLYGDWLKNAHPAKRPPDSWADELEKLITNKRVWLLLDGLDEISRSDPPNWLNSQLSGWRKNLRVVVTCRLNQWNTFNGLTHDFEVYRTLDYNYQTPTGEDQVLEFLTKWFGNEETAKQIRISLDDAGKERIKDLVKNPLRLTLFCASWAENQALPETQAELYRGFVNYLYRWKAQELQTEVNLRPQLDPALGKLAIAGLNRQPNRDGAVRRFRFTEQEIAKLWQDLPATLLPAAKRLGWLNEIGTEASDKIYAFFHPTFQEYFAACSINDWDYFLPRAHIDRPVPCQGETEPTYRVFEKEWQQTILLWIGRGDVSKNEKEELISRLVDFDDGCEELYSRRSFLIVAICVGEFKASKRAREIVYRLIYLRLTTGDINNIIGFVTEETIALTHRKYAIEALIQAVKTLDNIKVRNHAIYILGKIAIGNYEAIAVLVDMLMLATTSNFMPTIIIDGLEKIAYNSADTTAKLLDILCTNYDDDNIRWYFTVSLTKIAVGNSDAITTLIEILHTTNDREFQRLAAYVLGKIDDGNPNAIRALIDILQANNDYSLCTKTIDALGEIGIGNAETISTLIDILQDANRSDLHTEVTKILKKVAIGNPDAIIVLIEILQKSDDQNVRHNIANTLGGIAIDNLDIINLLFDMLNKTNNRNLRHDIVNILEKIAIGNAVAIAALSDILHKTDDRYFQYDIADTLNKIDNGNPNVNSTLIKILKTIDDNSLRFRAASLLEEIDEDNTNAINTLIEILQSTKNKYSLSAECEYFFRWKVADRLGRIDNGNYDAINVLIDILFANHEDRYKDRFFRSVTVISLGNIGICNLKVISALIKVLQTTDDQYLWCATAESLEKIAIGNPDVIAALIDIFQNHTARFIRHKAAESLEKIAIGDPNAIAALIKILQTRDGYHSWVQAVESLKRIIVPKFMPNLVSSLQPIFQEEKYFEDAFINFFSILWQCAQT